MNGLRSALAWCERRWYVVLALLFVSLGSIWFVRGALNDSADRKATRARIEQSANEAKDLAAQVKQQNDLLLSVTGPEAQARSAAATIDILRRNALSAGIEADCRSRRQQVRLAAPPDPTKPCVDQTPADVYPGVAGEPTKGP